MNVDADIAAAAVARARCGYSLTLFLVSVMLSWVNPLPNFPLKSNKGNCFLSRIWDALLQQGYKNNMIPTEPSSISVSPFLMCLGQSIS